MKTNRASFSLLAIGLTWLPVSCLDKAASERAEPSQDAIVAAPAKGLAGAVSGSSYLGPKEAKAAESAEPRQLIYNGEAKVLVSNYAEANSALTKRIEELGGHISDTQVSTTAEGKPQGTMKLRVPVAHFRTASEFVKTLGTVKYGREWTEDVSEEYLDVAARLANEKALEARLIKLMSHEGAKLEELVSVESKVGEVRGRIEQLEGRSRFLRNRIEYSSITVTLWEPGSAIETTDSTAYPLTWALGILGKVVTGSVGALLLAVGGGLPWVGLGYGLVRLRRRLKARPAANSK